MLLTHAVPTAIAFLKVLERYQNNDFDSSGNTAKSANTWNTHRNSTFYNPLHKQRLPGRIQDTDQL